MSKHKVKAHFTHKGRQYKPGDDFESDDQHEVQTLASQGHIEHPQGQQAQQGQPGSGQMGTGRSQTQGAGSDPSKSGSDPGKQGQDPSKSK